MSVIKVTFFNTLRQIHGGSWSYGMMWADANRTVEYIVSVPRGAENDNNLGARIMWEDPE
jgi:hypothetical protein